MSEVTEMGLTAHPPQSGEVGGQAHDLGALLLGEKGAVSLPLTFVLLPQLRIPVCLQGISDQPVVGVDAQVAALSKLGLVAFDSRSGSGITPAGETPGSPQRNLPDESR